MVHLDVWYTNIFWFGLWPCFGGSLRMGIVGMPNVGKSSLFNVLAKCDLGKAANFPFATIDPEESKVPVPDERFDWLVEQYKPKNQVPAFLTVLDIAGLTAGASTGAGLGNAFLANVRSVDGIFQVVRAFHDDEVIHVEGDVNPLRDMEIISTELRLKDLEWAEKALEQIKHKSKQRSKDSVEEKRRKEEKETVEKVYQLLSEGKDVRKAEWTNEQIEVINTLQLLTAKPVIYLVNMSEQHYADPTQNPWLRKIQAWVEENNPGDVVIPFSVAVEERLLQQQVASPEPENRALSQAESNVPGAVGTIIKAGYDGLELIRYFTCGKQEVRAWAVRNGTLAPRAAAVIHSDFEKKFISGEVMAYHDLRQHGTESAVRAAGKMANKGRGWAVEDGSICYWKLSS